MADIVLETERLILRDWREEDWGPFWKGTNTPAVMEWLGGVAGEDRTHLSGAWPDRARMSIGGRASAQGRLDLGAAAP